MVTVALSLVACSAPVAGPPARAPRPREVRLDGVDPCSLLTPAQRLELGLDQPPQSLPGGANGDRSLCSWRGEEPRAVDTSAMTLTTAGIEQFDSSSRQTVIRRVVVRDFPARQIVLQGHPEFCIVAIDVAQGKALEIQFADDGRPPPIPQSRLCSDALHVAELALGNLLAQR